MIGQIEIIKPGVQRVQVRHHLRRVGEAFGVEALFAPQFAGPRHPVEHDAVERELAAAVFLHHFDQFRLGFVTFLGLDVAERPLRQQRRLAGECAQLVNDPSNSGP
jgi:hypothetical protein